MKSCDTNIFLYYLNSECPEHVRAKTYLEKQFISEDFAVCELVLVELYVLLRTPQILSSPVSSREALQIIKPFRNHPRWRVIDYPGDLMSKVWKEAERPNFPRRSIFDARLALTLLHHGIDEFATRNIKDFEEYPFRKLLNPIDK